MWRGAAGLCCDERRRVLLVLQGGPGERRTWAVPAGGLLAGESFEACCVREVREETGYEVAVGRELIVKTSSPTNAKGRFELRVFAAEVVGGALAIHDPDRVIHAVGWFAADQVRGRHFGFPEDRDFVLRYLGARA